MGKLSKKLIVYLDQNFISEMAKADKADIVNPRFRKIYELLHLGFVDEKLVVPSSQFHDIESSLAIPLKDRISEYQAYLGQIRLNHHYDIMNNQLVVAAKSFLGFEGDQHTYHIAYNEDPDRVKEQFTVKVDLHMERWHSNEERLNHASRVDGVRVSINQNKVSYQRQFDLEFEAARDSFLRSWDSVGWLFSNDTERIKKFAYSKYFSEIPIIEISCRMWAKLLTHYSGRTIKSGDATDIEIISAYLPYVDVLATDTFMANVIRDLKYDEKYKTEVFGAKEGELELFENYTQAYLSDNVSINRPNLSLFILPDKKIRERERCFDFFKSLGILGMGPKDKGYFEMHVFDDGEMPTYYDSRVKMKIPFTGLQDIKRIRIKKGISLSEILEICKRTSKSDKFVLIDKFFKAEDDFLTRLYLASQENKDKFMGYRIY